MGVTYGADGGVGRILLDRPEKMNAIDVALATDLGRAIAALGADPGVNVILIRGAGGNFCAAILTPLNAYVLEDGTAAHTPLMALHRFEKPFEEDAQYLDVYTDQEILHYKLSAGEDLTFLGRHPHLFERVPVIVCPANAERKSGFEDVVSLFDAYNALNSDLVNEIAEVTRTIEAGQGDELMERRLSGMKEALEHYRNR